MSSRRWIAAWSRGPAFARRAAPTLLLTLSVACGTSSMEGIDAAGDAGDAGEPAATPPTIRVLFIGNSYTQVNDLPKVVAALGESSQSPVRFEVASHTPGGQTWRATTRIRSSTS